MKKLAIFLAVVAGFVACAACSNTNTPEAVAKKAITALQKGDYDTYASTFDLSSNDQKWLAGMAEEKAKEGMDAKGGIKSFKITDS